MPTFSQVSSGNALLSCSPALHCLLLLIVLPQCAGYGLEFCTDMSLRPLTLPRSLCNSSDEVWKAAAVPLLCPGTVEHGVMNLRSLTAAIDACCGCYCVFPGNLLPRPPSVSLGWTLNDSCWVETGSSEMCAQTFWSQRPTHLPPVGVDCGPPPSVTVPLRKTSAQPCDLILSPEEYPPNGFCGPRVVLTGALHCSINRVANALRLHPNVLLRQAAHTFLPCDRSKPRDLCRAVNSPAQSTLTGLPLNASYTINVNMSSGQCGDFLTFSGLQSDSTYCASSCKCRLGAEIYEHDYFSFGSNYNLNGTPEDSSSLNSRRRYAERLPNTFGTDTITFDTSPSYFSPFFPSIPSKIKQLLPHAKIVIVLCEPVQRLISHFNSAVQLNLSALEAFAIASNFSALVASFSRTEFTGGDAERYAIHGQLWAEFLERGYYAQILLDWLSAFGKRNVLVIDANRWGSHSAQQLIEFLDLPTERYPWIQEQQQRAYAPLNTVVGLEGISPGDLITLKHLYADHNHWLRKLTRIRFK